jgi:hypothetical protein
MQALRGRTFALLLNLLLPGLGHVLWREYLFGVFIFLITLIAAVLFVVTYFIHLASWARLVLLALPGVFYLFTFFDLNKTVRTRQKQFRPHVRTAAVLLLLGLTYQLLAPSAVGNFLWRNSPELFTIDDSRFAPVLSRGDLAVANPLAYRVDIAVLDRPVFHQFPRRFDLVRFNTGARRLTGLVVGQPAEAVEISAGVVVANGAPVFARGNARLLLQGEWPLTSSDDYSILVATLNLGIIDSVHQVPLPMVAGKVSRLF